VLVESEGKQSYGFLPDVRIDASRPRKKPSKKGSTALAELAGDVEPIAMRPFIQDEHRETFIEIYEANPAQRRVTSIEVLSPSNKRPGTEGWALYQRKRQSLLLGDVNLVEIDLLRGGQRMPVLDLWPDSPYSLLVARAGTQLCRAWPAHYRRPLPGVPVPLLKPDPDIPLAIQPLIDETYERFRYAQTIDYRKPLTPSLDASETAWLKRRLQAIRSR
jgi:hypothetical protein